MQRLIFAIEVDEDGESLEPIVLFALLPALSTPRKIPLVSFPLMTTSPSEAVMSIVWNCKALRSGTLSEESNPLARGRFVTDSSDCSVHVSFFLTQSAFGKASVGTLSVASRRIRFEVPFNRNRLTCVCFRLFDVFGLDPSPAKDKKHKEKNFISDYVK